MKSIAFFHNKDRVGKTSLVYHLAWMYASLEVALRCEVPSPDFETNSP